MAKPGETTRPLDGSPSPSAAADGGLVVRAATPHDLPAILGIQRAAGLPAGDEVIAALIRAITSTATVVVVAEVDGNVAGWAKTHHWPRPAGAAPAGHYLGGVAVSPAARQRGVARALTAARMDWVRRRADVVYYCTNVTNHASIALHRPWGFVEVARAESFHTTRFDGGVGLLLRADLA